MDFAQAFSMEPGALESAYQRFKQIAEIEARLTAPPNRGLRAYLLGGTAVVPVVGGMTKGFDPIGALFGFTTSYDEIRGAVSDALQAGEAKRILLDIDSPGGVVSGLDDLSEFIQRADRIKPVFAYSNGVMASAAYRIASAARLIGLAESTQAGSIGVISTHVDQSKALDRAGIKVSYLHSGKYKAIGNSAEPLSDEARDYIQSRLDTLCQIFVQNVARARKLRTDQADQWADGQIFLGRDAVRLGLADGLGSRDDFIQHIQKG